MPYRRTGRPLGRPRIYDFDTLLDGSRRVLTKGVDFQCSTLSMQQMIQKEIRRRWHARFPGDDDGYPDPPQLKTRRTATTVTILPRRHERAQSYPWDLWLDGELHVLVHGQDFRCRHEALIQQARAAAKKRGKRVKTRTRIDPNVRVRVVALKAYPREETPS